MSNSLVIDYYYWVLSDWAYFGGPRLQSLADRHGLTVNHMPIKLPYVYARTGGILLHLRSKQRQDYRLAEIERWQRRLGMPINVAPRFFPTNEDPASRLIIAAKLKGLPTGEISQAFLKAVWVDQLDIASRDTLLSVARRFFTNAEELLDAAQSPAVAAEYERYTEEAIARGVFGSPFYLFRNDIFWGQDRLDFLEEAVISAKSS
jgi:2-hydroxychromene-2-carboxylate isomerase